MWRRLLVLDLVLAGLVAYAALRVRQSWFEFQSTHRVEAIEPEKESVRNLPVPANTGRSSEEWTEISIKDPFSFDRSDVAIVAPKPAATTQPKPILFGTLSVGNQWIAMLAPAGTNRESQQVKVGESIGDWQVVEIHEKSVVVAADNGFRQTVGLSDATQIPRDYSRTLSSAGAPPPVVTAVNPGVPAGQPSTTASSAAPPAAAPAATPGEQSKSKILHTPFGDIIRTDPQQ